MDVLDNSNPPVRVPADAATGARVRTLLEAAGDVFAAALARLDDGSRMAAAVLGARRETIFRVLIDLPGGRIRCQVVAGGETVEIGSLRGARELRLVPAAAVESGSAGDPSGDILN
ncbi:MAG: hypothetical protein U1E42_09740 [Rhodospirillales bacterium]